MPNHVISFEIQGPDAEALRQFYANVFGWELFAFPGGGYTAIETSAHVHGDGDSTTYTGPDAYRNEGVTIGSAYAQPAWKFAGEQDWRSFEPGVSGGITQGEARVTFYIQVPDLAASLATVRAHGGAAVMDPVEVAPNVVIAAFTDPAGNRVHLIRGGREG